MIMGKLLGRVRKLSTTPTAEDFADFREQIDKGEGPARGFTAPTRREALRGLDSMVTRCPHVLVLIKERGDVGSLIEHARSRRSAAV